MPNTYNAADITEALMLFADKKQREILMKFFKTGKGEYGHGDQFLGIKCPQTRSVVNMARLKTPLTEIEKLLASPWHEVRLCGLLLLVEEMKAATPSRRLPRTAFAERRKAIADFYLAHLESANNWDLVDMSCPKILGIYLLFPLPDGTMPDRSLLDRLAADANLWKQRVAMVTNWMLIRCGQYDDALRITSALIGHKHDLILKAVGWMLREIWKKNEDVLEGYLETHSRALPRTALRYAIEKMSEPRRLYWLNRK